jgi:hypothetical protein
MATTKRQKILGIAGGLFLIGYLFQGHYSDDMLHYIAAVNRDLYDAGITPTTTPLPSSISVTPTTTGIAEEMQNAAEHAHTLQDKSLVRTIRKATEKPNTQDDRVQLIISEWQRMM